MLYDDISSSPHISKESRLHVRDDFLARSSFKEADSLLDVNIDSVEAYKKKQKALDRILKNYDKHISTSKICSRVKEKFKVKKTDWGQFAETIVESPATINSNDIKSLYELSVGRMDLSKSYSSSQGSSINIHSDHLTQPDDKISSSLDNDDFMTKVPDKFTKEDEETCMKCIDGRVNLEKINESIEAENLYSNESNLENVMPATGCVPSTATNTAETNYNNINNNCNNNESCSLSISFVECNDCEDVQSDSHIGVIEKTNQEQLIEPSVVSYATDNSNNIQARNLSQNAASVYDVNCQHSIDMNGLLVVKEVLNELITSAMQLMGHSNEGHPEKFTLNDNFCDGGKDIEKWPDVDMTKVIRVRSRKKPSKHGKDHFNKSLVSSRELLSAKAYGEDSGRTDEIASNHKLNQLKINKDHHCSRTKTDDDHTVGSLSKKHLKRKKRHSEKEKKRKRINSNSKQSEETESDHLHTNATKHRVKVKKIKTRARYRSRSFSVSHTFDEEKGVWREKRIVEKSRVPLFTDSQKRDLRMAAIKAAENSDYVNRYVRPFRATAVHLDKRSKVDELTNFCKSLARKSYDSDSSDSDDEKEKCRMMSDAEDYVGCPSLIDKQTSIKMKIKDSTQLPVLNAKDKQVREYVLKQQFPVSSGVLHHERNKGWVPVEKPTECSFKNSPPPPSSFFSSSSPPMITVPSKPLTQAAEAAIQIANAQTAQAPDVTPDPTQRQLAENEKKNLDKNVEISLSSADFSRKHFSSTKPSILGMRSRILRCLNSKEVQTNYTNSCVVTTTVQNPTNIYNGLVLPQPIIQTSTFKTLQDLCHTTATTSATTTSTTGSPSLFNSNEYAPTPEYLPHATNSRLLISLMLMQHPDARIPLPRASTHVTPKDLFGCQNHGSGSTDDRFSDATAESNYPPVYKKIQSSEHQNGTTAFSPIFSLSNKPSQTFGPRSEVGRILLMKMGWKEGEQVGIGSVNPGLMKPIEIVMKNDRRGLQTSEESLRMINIEKRIYKGQHPVSYLIIFCLKRRWLMPEFELVDEGGPPHMKFFIYKVRVNGVDYQPATSSCNKKSAKVEAAICCLQKIDHPG